MDKLKISGNWNELKGKVKRHWGSLTDDDLTYEEGREDEMIGKIQKKTGEAREQVIQYINSLSIHKT